MMDLYSDSAWIKINRLVHEKYGKRLSYRPLKIISEDMKELKSFYTKGDDLVIPLKARNCDLGDIVVTQGSFLNIQQKTEISDLIKFLVEPKLYNIKLKKSEESLIQSKSEIRPSIGGTSRGMLTLIKNEKIRPKTLSQVLLLKSSSEFTRNRVALKIHDMSERNLFIPIEDIASTLKTIEDIRSLSDISVYIKDFSVLPKNLILLLSEYLKSSVTNNFGPLFLVGTEKTMKEFEDDLEIPSSLKSDLMAFYFDIDRVPMAQQISSDVLELIFFSFDSVKS